MLQKGGGKKRRILVFLCSELVLSPDGVVWSTVVLLLSRCRAFSSCQEVFHTSRKWCVGTSRAPRDGCGRMCAQMHPLHTSCSTEQHPFHNECVGGGQTKCRITDWELWNLTLMARLFSLSVPHKSLETMISKGRMAQKRSQKGGRDCGWKEGKVQSVLSGSFLTYVRSTFQRSL